MDIQQFLAEGPLGALLGLALIPALAGLMLIGYLAFTLTRRSKKSKMNLGLQTGPKEAPAVEKAQKSRPQQVDDSAPEISPKPKTTTSSVSVDAPTPARNLEPELVDLSSRLAATAPPQPRPQTQPQPPPAADGPAEVMRLLRQPESGQLIVEIAGQQFTKLAEIKDRKLGQFVLRLVAQLLAFTGGALLTESGVKSMAAPPAAPLPEPPFTPVSREAVSQPVTASGGSVPPPPPPEAEAEFLASISRPPAPPPPKRGGFLGIGAKSASTPSPGELLELNLADEINTVVQKNLARSPLGDSNRVEIASNLGGGLRILVNQQAYASPEEIPDEAVKKLIKDSIKEWERS